MDTSVSLTRPREPIPREAWRRLAGLPISMAVGAACGAIIGGIGGRIAMRLAFLVDRDTRGALTDFGTIGEFTVGGSLTLLALCAITGAIGGAIYIGLRRWLPWAGAARGLFFGLMMMFGPGVIFLGEIDLQIAEPAVPIYFMFIALIAAYGVAVALLTDRLRPEPAIDPGPRTKVATTALQSLVGLGIVAMAILTTGKVYDEAGSCLSADQEGGCAVRATD